MKEITYLHAEGYPAGELKHGPIAMVDSTMTMVVICPRDELFDKTISNLQEVKARGGRIVSIGNKGDEQLRKLSDYFLEYDFEDDFSDVILAAIPIQLLAYHAAVMRGTDVDKPRNLAKSVTVE
jgi:glucosamine--fructose-6-phosphate aminotransferase (isomerizing)